MTTLGVILGNRGFFPDELCKSARVTILKVLEEEGFKVVSLSQNDTKYGTVETFQDAKKCAELFRRHADEIDGILVTLPNFGDELGVADSIRLSGLNVPVLIHAFPDVAGNMDLAHRRDSFCGKMSVCNNLTQYRIPFTLTKLHVVDPESKDFRSDLSRFGGTCRVIRGLRNVRLGLIGARPSAFATVRFSEKILEESGISVVTVDLSEIFGQAWNLKNTDPAVTGKKTSIREYIKTGGIPDEAIVKMAKLGVVIDRFIEENELAGTAVQCWTSMEKYFGVVPCTVMSMLSNSLIPSACETDITGLIGMYAMVKASGKPSALLDWNNNFGDDPEKGVVFHCSNLPMEFFEEGAEMYSHDILADTVGRENACGNIVGRIKPSQITFCRVSTDDALGTVRVYLGEGEITTDRIDSFGGYGVVRVPNFQRLLAFICENGFEHHTALSQSLVADSLEEAFTKYLDWEVYRHN